VRLGRRRTGKRERWRGILAIQTQILGDELDAAQAIADAGPEIRDADSAGDPSRQTNVKAAVGCE
jgi:hypothetical protein